MSKDIQNEIGLKLSDYNLPVGTNYYGEFNKQISHQWSALENLEAKGFTEESDVWSFGVLMWEIFSNGSEPYGTKTHQEVLQFLKSGNRLENPKADEQDAYQLMRQCWDEDLLKRFWF